MQELPCKWLLLDIELLLDKTTIRELALVSIGKESRIVYPDIDKLKWVIGEIEQAQVIVGHNIRRHDLPELYRLAQRQLPQKLDEKVCDTLELSSLFFVNKPTHKLTKFYREEKGLSDPVEDSWESYEVYQQCKAITTDINNDLPFLVRHWATYLLPNSYLCLSKKNLQNNKTNWGLIHPYFSPIDLTEWEKLKSNNPWLDIYGLQNYLEALKKSGKKIENLGAVVFLNWLHQINQSSACRPTWLELEFLTFREAEQQASSSITPGVLNSELKYVFGKNYEFREGQLEIIQSLLAKEVVPLGILPTGGGKSLTFQLPALILSRRYRGLSVIVSPLQALMEDQVTSLKMKLEEQGHNNYAERVEFLAGSQTLFEQKKIIEAIYEGKIDILYLSPERLRQPTIQTLLKCRLPCLWVLDEAHTLSQWGHDFRPDFLRIAKTINDVNKDKKTIQLGFVTATATLKVIEDLEKAVHDLDNFVNLQRIPVNGEIFKWRPELTTHIEKIDKPKSFSPKSTSEVQDTKRFRRTTEILNEHRNQEQLALGISEKTLEKVAIIYVPTRKMAEIYAKALTEAEENFKAKAFHSRVNSVEKKEVLKDFKNGNLEVIVATNAFGMGIDRERILTVIHVAPPATPEAYLQEIGRLARNAGEKGNAYLFLDEAEDFSWIFEQEAKSQINMQALKRCWDLIRAKLKEGSGEAWVSGLDLVEPLAQEDKEILETQIRVTLFYLEQANLIKQKESCPCILEITLNQDLVQDNIYLEISNNEDVTYKIKCYLWELGVRKLNQKIKLDIREMVLVTSTKPSEIIKCVGQLVKSGILKWHYEIAFKFALKSPESITEKIKLFGTNIKVFLDWIEEKGEFDSERTIPLYKPLEEELQQQEQQFKLEETLKTLTRLKLVQYRKEGSITYFYFKGDEEIKSQWLKRAREICKLRFNDISSVTTTLVKLFKEKKWKFSESQLLNVADLSDLSENFQGSGVLEILELMHQLHLVSMGRGSLSYESLYHLQRIESSKWSDKVYRPLQENYRQRRRRIHAMIKVITEKDYQIRISILKDYFTLSLEDFNSKYFSPDIIQEDFAPPKAYQLLEGLNDIQKRIVKDDTSHALLVLAGPGSGKTHTIVRRIAYLILARGVLPEKILVLAYNRIAAAELRKRLYDLLGSQGSRVHALTFHALAAKLTGLKKTDAPKDGKVKSFDWLLQEAAQDIQENHPAYQYILVDEYQDIDELKYDIIRALASFNSQDGDQEQKSFLVAVGDDDQNLYEFQGADIKFIQEFKKDYYLTEQHTELVQNYRADSTLVEFTNEFIQKAIPQEKRLKKQDIKSVSPNSGQILWGQYDHLYDVAKWIAEEIQKLKNLNVPLEEIAILAHQWDDLRFLHHILREQSISYQFYDNNDKLRPANSLIGQEIIKKLWQEPTKKIPNPQNYIEQLRKELGYSDKDAAWSSLKYALAQYSKITQEQIADILEGARTVRNGGVILSSLHSAKGSEFKYVFILEERIWLGNESSESCARRLYVGFTRAKEGLYILINKKINSLNNAKKHPSLVTVEVLQNLTQANHSVKDIEIVEGEKPKTIYYDWLPNYGDLFLSEKCILNGQERIKLYAKEWKQLNIDQKALKFSFLDQNWVDIGGVVTVFSNDGQEKLNKHNNGCRKITSADGYTIFRVERDDALFKMAGFIGDATHHYIVLPRLEIEEKLPDK